MASVIGSDRFIGRTGELSLLRSRVEAARQGTPQIVTVKGPAGIGKTALLRRFISGLDGVTVLRASGEESETTVSFGVADQLLRSGGVSNPGLVGDDAADF